MKRLWIVLLLGLAACTAASSSDLQPFDAAQNKPAPTTEKSILPDYGPAPEFVNDVWLNSDQPLRLAALAGKVVAVDMWTFG